MNWLQDWHQNLSWKSGVAQGRSTSSYSCPWWSNRIVFAQGHIEGSKYRLQMQSRRQRARAARGDGYTLSAGDHSDFSDEDISITRRLLPSSESDWPKDIPWHDRIHWSGFLNVVSLTVATAGACYLCFWEGWRWYFSVAIWPIIYLGIPVIVGLIQGLTVLKRPDDLPSR